MRREPRFVSNERVEMRVSGRQEMRTLWTENVSRGGLFVVTEDPPPLRTRVDVEVETPDGALTLKAEVVHVLDAEAAQAVGMVAGVGLQFVELTEKQKAAVDRYVDGIASRLKAETDDLPTTPESDLMTAVVCIFTGVESNDLYEAISANEAIDDEAITERLSELKARLESSPKALTPAQQIRVANAKKMLARIARVLGDPGRRIEYDLRTQRKKIEAILQTKHGLEIRKMRDQWKQSFPERVEKAKQIATEAMQYWEMKDGAKAIACAEEALTLDPLNRDLRSAIKEWKSGQAKPANKAPKSPGST